MPSRSAAPSIYRVLLAMAFLYDDVMIWYGAAVVGSLGHPKVWRSAVSVPLSRHA